MCVLNLGWTNRREHIWWADMTTFLPNIRAIGFCYAFIRKGWLKKPQQIHMVYGLNWRCRFFVCIIPLVGKGIMWEGQIGSV